MVNGDIKDVEFVFPAYVNRAAIAAEMEEEHDSDHEGHDHADDGATTMTSFAATVMAAVYALTL